MQCLAANVLGRCPVSGIVSEARMGEVDRCWYWQARNCPLYIAHYYLVTFQYLTILCCYLTHLACIRMDFLWF